MTVPRLHQLCHSPRLYVADGFATEAEAAYARTCGLDPAWAEDRGLATRHDPTGYSFEMPVEGDRLLEGLRARIHETLGLVNVHGGTMRFRHYATGEGHPPHLDCYEIQGAHLICTALLHLGDCEAGGETHFPRAYPRPVSVRPRQGRLVAWFNYYPNGAPDQSSLHEGAAVVRGTKTTLTAFIYGRLSDARMHPDAAAGWQDPA